MPTWLLPALLGASSPAPPNVSLHVDLDVAPEGIGVTMRVGGAWGGPLRMSRIAPLTEISITGLSVEVDGRAVDADWNGDRVDLPAGSTAVVRYVAVPGGLGRHGHQGVLAPDHATFDGRVVLRSDADVWPITIRYGVPDGWAVATPHRRDGERWVVDEVPRWAAVEALHTACVAVGNLVVDARSVGATPVAVWTWGGFDAAHRKTLVDGTHAMAQWFHTTVGFDTGVPFLLAWVPRPQDAGVFGGAWATGACYEGTGELREWQLLGHRFAHPMNKYPPAGVMPRDRRDHWFVEGFASWVEIRSTEAVGLDRTGAAWSELYRKYISTRWRRPGVDAALAREPWQVGEDGEFLHYVKGPLVVREIDQVLAQHGVSLTDVVRRWTQSGGRYDLRGDLVAVVPEVATVFERLVDVPGFLAPADLAMPGEPGEAAALLDGEPLGVNEVVALLASGDVERFAQVLPRLSQDEAIRRSLERAGGEVLTLSQLRSVDPRISVDVRRMHREIPVAAPSGGCVSTRPPLAVPSDTATGLAFAAARTLEARLGPDAPDVAGVRLTAGDGNAEGRPDVLATWRRTGLRVEVQFSSPPPELWFELLDGDRVVARSVVDTMPGWSRAWTVWSEEELVSPGARLVRIGAGARVLAERAVWIAP